MSENPTPEALSNPKTIREAREHHRKYGDMIFHAPDGRRYLKGREICGLNECPLHYPQNKHLKR